MSSISFKLDAFEGPLDLLLHLISKHKLNIYDIEISLLLDQYLEYISDLETDDYESAADFLEMAARLIYIKTCSLLPQPEEAKELKKELEGRIIEYSLCKKAAEKLKGLYVGGDVFVRQQVKLPVNRTYTATHDVSVLYDAYMGISTKVKKYKPLRANVFSPIVSHRIVSVTSKIIFVLKKLYKTGECEMSQLYSGITDKSEKVATFLAVLELTKSGRIYINDDNTMIKFHRANKKHTEKTDKAETMDYSPSAADSDRSEEVVSESIGEQNYGNDNKSSDISLKVKAESQTADKEVKFSSERISKAHTISMKPDTQAIAAFAPIAAEVQDESEAELPDCGREEESFATAGEIEISASESRLAAPETSFNLKLNLWRYGKRCRMMLAAKGKNNLWRYRLV